MKELTFKLRSQNSYNKRDNGVYYGIPTISILVRELQSLFKLSNITNNITLQFEFKFL